MLKRHASGGSSIVPRICRELPVGGGWGCNAKRVYFSCNAATTARQSAATTQPTMVANHCCAAPILALPQVSWLTLWLLLLGTEDHSCKQQLDNKQAHRRPAEADMVDSAAQLAAVSADVEVGGRRGTAALGCCVGR